MKKITLTLDGWKTHIIAAVSVVTGLLAYFHGTASLSTALTSMPGLMVYLGAGLSALRVGVAKAEAAATRVEAKLPASLQSEVDPKVAEAEAAVNKAVK